MTIFLIRPQPPHLYRLKQLRLRLSMLGWEKPASRDRGRRSRLCVSGRSSRASYCSVYTGEENSRGKQRPNRVTTTASATRSSSDYGGRGCGVRREGVRYAHCTIYDHDTLKYIHILYCCRCTLFLEGLTFHTWSLVRLPCLGPEPVRSRHRTLPSTQVGGGGESRDSAARLTDGKRSRRAVEISGEARA